jgi:hypothetical protein
LKLTKKQQERIRKAYLFYKQVPIEEVVEDGMAGKHLVDEFAGTDHACQIPLHLARGNPFIKEQPRHVSENNFCGKLLGASNEIYDKYYGNPDFARFKKLPKMGVKVQCDRKGHNRKDCSGCTHSSPHPRYNLCIEIRSVNCSNCSCIPIR